MAINYAQSSSVPAEAGKSGRVAVILPCLNEEAAIAGVVQEFRRHLPQADIIVIDNGSTDRTADCAIAAGARVRRCSRRGKGNALRFAFADIDADIYLIADGDGTYDAAAAPLLVGRLDEEGLDMVVGIRRDIAAEAYRRGHRLGNQVFNRLVYWTFGGRFTDIFSGYRAFSRRYVKSFPALANGFDIETEMSVHAIELNLPTAEILTDYRERASGSSSKLNTYSDGLHILWRIMLLLKHLRPLALFTLAALLLGGLSLLLGLPVVFEFLETGLVRRLPTALAAASLGIMALISFATGLILDTLAYAQRENKRLFYLAVSERGMTTR